MSDILEEHERSEIRGTLISLAVSNAASTAAKATEIIDPYTREARIWLQPGMGKDKIIDVVLKKIGLIKVKEEGDLLYFAPQRATTVIKLVIDKHKCAPQTGGTGA